METDVSGPFLYRQRQARGQALRHAGRRLLVWHRHERARVAAPALSVSRAADGIVQG